MLTLKFQRRGLRLDLAVHFVAFNKIERAPITCISGQKWCLCIVMATSAGYCALHLTFRVFSTYLDAKRFLLSLNVNFLDLLRLCLAYCFEGF